MKAPPNKKAGVCKKRTEEKEEKEEKEENTESSLGSLGSLGSLNSLGSQCSLYVGERERHPCGVCAALSQKEMTAYMVTFFTRRERSRGRRQAPPNKKAEENRRERRERRERRFSPKLGISGLRILCPIPERIYQNFV